MCTQGTEESERKLIESLLSLPDSLASKSKKKLNEHRPSVSEQIELSDDDDIIEL